MGHTELMAVVAAAGVCMRGLVNTNNNKKQRYNSHSFVPPRMIYVHVISLELTCAGLHAFKPTVINVSVAGTSTVPKPSTARSAATGSAGFFERAALWARHRVDLCGDLRANN